jgi:PhzF family phenazine biosynthesis protein
MSASVPLRFHTLDAFTTTAFTGNPAAVFLPPSRTLFDDTTLLLNLSKEFSLPNTAVLFPLATDSSSPIYSARFFSRTKEITLCGHASLAASHALFTLYHSATTITLETTLAGTLHAHKGADGRVTLDFPADHTVLKPLEEAEGRYQRIVMAVLLAAPSLQIENIVGLAWGGLGPIVELTSEVDLKGLRVDVGGFVSYSLSLSSSRSY